MELSRSARIRIANLIGIVSVEMVGLDFFSRRGGLGTFAIVSGGAILALLPLLWLEWLRKRGASEAVSVGTAMMVPATAAAYAAHIFWQRGQRQIAIGDAIMSFAMVMVYLTKLTWPKHGIVSKHMLGILLYSGIIVMQWPENVHIAWAILLLLPALAMAVSAVIVLYKRQGATN